MSLPKGYHADETKVCRLKKSLYGLEQEPKAWNTTLTKDLATLDFNPIDTAGSVFVRSKNTCLSYIIVYVDDMLIVTHEEREATQIVKDTGKIYEIKDLGTADSFLGIKLEKIGSKTMKPSQAQYIKDVLTCFHMETVNP